MASRRFISTGIWGDAFFEELTGVQKLVFIYLTTARESTICGYYQCSYKTISNDISFPLEEVKKAVGELCKSGKIVYDGGVVFVKKMAEYQPSFSQKSFEDHCRKMFNDLNKPDNLAFQEFVSAHGESIGFAEERYKTRKPNKSNAKNLGSGSGVVGDCDVTGTSLEGEREKEKGERENTTLSLERGVGKTFLDAKDITPPVIDLPSRFMSEPTDTEKAVTLLTEIRAEQPEGKRTVTQFQERDLRAKIYQHGIEKVLDAITKCGKKEWYGTSDQIDDFIHNRVKEKDYGKSSYQSKEDKIKATVNDPEYYNNLRKQQALKAQGA